MTDGLVVKIEKDGVFKCSLQLSRETIRLLYRSYLPTTSRLPFLAANVRPFPF